MDSHSGLQLIAYGVLNMAALPAAAWLGTRRGFTDTLVDNGGGDWTVQLDATLTQDLATDGGTFWSVQQIAATGGVTGPVASSVEIVNAALRTARIRVLDTAGMAADPILCLKVYRAVAG